MSHTTTVPTPAHAVAPPPAEPRPTRARGRSRLGWRPAVLAGAPLLAIVDSGLHPAEPNDPGAAYDTVVHHVGMWDLAHGVGPWVAILFVPAAVALRRVAPGRLGAVGVALLALGACAQAFFLAAHGAATSVLLHDHGLRHADAVRLIGHVESSPVVTAQLPLMLALPLGLVLAGTAAWRAGALRRPVAALVAVSGLPLVFPLAVSMWVGAVASFGVMAVAFALTARVVARLERA